MIFPEEAEERHNNIEEHCLCSLLLWLSQGPFFWFSLENWRELTAASLLSSPKASLQPQERQPKQRASLQPQNCPCISTWTLQEPHVCTLALSKLVLAEMWSLWEPVLREKPWLLSASLRFDPANSSLSAFPVSHLYKIMAFCNWRKVYLMHNWFILTYQREIPKM